MILWQNDTFVKHTKWQSDAFTTTLNTWVVRQGASHPLYQNMYFGIQLSWVNIRMEDLMNVLQAENNVHRTNNSLLPLITFNIQHVFYAKRSENAPTWKSRLRIDSAIIATRAKEERENICGRLRHYVFCWSMSIEGFIVFVILTDLFNR